MDIDDTIISRDTCSGQYYRIEEMFAYYLSLVNNGMIIYFVSARKHSNANLSKTMKQLVEFGFGAFNGVFLMPYEATTSSLDIAWFKTVIRKIIQNTQNIQIVLNIGNAWHDLLNPKLYKILSPNHKDTNIYVFSAIDESAGTCIKLPYKHQNNFSLR